MDNHVTQKFIRNVYGNKVFSVGYCGAQNLLSGSSRFAYNSGVYGWNCDYYNFNGVIICTGYRPHGRNGNEITSKYEEIARSIRDNRALTWDERNAQIAAIRDQWIKELDLL